MLNPLFQRALGVGKEVRNQTAIGKHKLSVASVAVDLAKHIHGELDRARLLIVGAGEIAELAVKYLVSAGVREMSIVNRSATERRGEVFDEAANAKRVAAVEHWAEERSKGLYASSRVSDDGIIDPRDTRTVLGLALSAVHSNTVEGQRGYGVFRM